MYIIVSLLSIMRFLLVSTEDSKVTHPISLPDSIVVNKSKSTNRKNVLRQVKLNKSKVKVKSKSKRKLKSKPIVTRNGNNHK